MACDTATSQEWIRQVLRLCGVTEEDIELVRSFKIEGGFDQVTTIVIDRLVNVESDKQ